MLNEPPSKSKEYILEFHFHFILNFKRVKLMAKKQSCGSKDSEFSGTQGKPNPYDKANRKEPTGLQSSEIVRTPRSVQSERSVSNVWLLK